LKTRASADGFPVLMARETVGWSGDRRALGAASEPTLSTERRKPNDLSAGHRVILLTGDSRTRQNDRS
jgi:hypothetical protein